MGECPDWYLLFKAARYLGVAPWELENQHPLWLEWAVHALTAEASARNNAQSKGRPN